ncbi:MAG: OmpH family outer membrane protein [Bacteroidia bacterium]|nr:OmpH family outer membrane protein [Bacteroidia bacterium]
MKQASFIFNVIILVAVAVLYLLHFTGKKAQIIPDRKKVVVTAGHDTLTAPIVYVNLDSLLLQYKYSKDLNDNFLKKKEKVKADLNDKMQAFEKEVAAFQDKVKRGSFLSQESAETQQAELLEKKQSLEQLQTEMSGRLMDEQEKLNHQLYDSIVSFLKVYNKKYNYQYILSRSYGGDMLLGNDQLNITGTIIQIMNQQYDNKSGR